MRHFKSTIVSNSSVLIGDRSFKRLLQKSKINKISLLYHTISDQELPHIKNLYNVKNTIDFNNDLDLILQHFEPVSLKEYLNFCKQGSSKKPVIHFTFDDGLIEFYDVIAPVLLNKGIPATCFLNTDFIDNKDLFYRYKASVLIEKVKVIQENSNQINHIIKDWQLSNDLADVDIIKFLLNIEFKDRYLLDDLARRLEIDFQDFLQTQKPYLTTEQINSLINQGFTFGGHSLNHPEYYNLGEDEQLRQTIESCENTARQFNLDYKIFSFPFTDDGVNQSFFIRLKNEIPDITTFGCAGLKLDSAVNNYQRIPVEQYNSDALSIIKGELIYYRLLKILGLEKIKRQ